MKLLDIFQTSPGEFPPVFNSVKYSTFYLAILVIALNI